RALGYEVTMLSARVRLNSQFPASPRTHMFLRVDVAGKPHLCDPGFGGPGPRRPIPLALGAELDAGAWRFRIASTPEGTWSLQRVADAAVDLYHFTLERQHPIDFAVANHFTSTFSSSIFVQRLIARRARPDGVVSLLNRELSIRSSAGEEKRSLSD